MKLEVINSLKSNLADLTYILFVVRKEFELIVRNTEDGKMQNELCQAISALKDSNNDIIKLYHEIKSNETRIRNEWYNEGSKIQGLQREVDNLKKSIDVLLSGNRKLLNLNSK